MQAVQQRLRRLCVGSLNDSVRDELGELLRQDWDDISKDLEIDWEFVLKTLLHHVNVQTLKNQPGWDKEWDGVATAANDPVNNNTTLNTNTCREIVFVIMTWLDSETPYNPFDNTTPEIVLGKRLKERFDAYEKLSGEFVTALCTGKFMTRPLANQLLTALGRPNDTFQSRERYSNVTMRAKLQNLFTQAAKVILQFLLEKSEWMNRTHLSNFITENAATLNAMYGWYFGIPRVTNSDTALPADVNDKSTPPLRSTSVIDPDLEDPEDVLYGQLDTI